MSTLANVGFFFATTVLLKINEMSSLCVPSPRKVVGEFVTILAKIRLRNVRVRAALRASLEFNSISTFPHRTNISLLLVGQDQEGMVIAGVGVVVVVASSSSHSITLAISLVQLQQPF